MEEENGPGRRVCVCFCSRDRGSSWRVLPGRAGLQVGGKRRGAVAIDSCCSAGQSATYEYEYLPPSASQSQVTTSGNGNGNPRRKRDSEEWGSVARPTRLHWVCSSGSAPLVLCAAAAACGVAGPNPVP